jgi:hypothetical protein
MISSSDAGFPNSLKKSLFSLDRTVPQFVDLTIFYLGHEMLVTHLIFPSFSFTEGGFLPQRNLEEGRGQEKAQVQEVVRRGLNA